MQPVPALDVGDPGSHDGSQVVEDSVYRVELGGNDRPARVKAIGLDENVLSGPEGWPDPIVDGGQRVENVVAPVLALAPGVTPTVKTRESRCDRSPPHLSLDRLQ